jgi:hypothetical protein
MTGTQLKIALLVQLALAATLVGLIVRERWQRCLAFALYVTVALGSNVLAVWWPERFYQRWFYLEVQQAFAVLKLAILLELGGQFLARPATRARHLRFETPVLAGLVAYHVLFAWLPLRWFAMDPGFHGQWRAIDPSAYLLLACAWAYLAWRPGAEARPAGDVPRGPLSAPEPGGRGPLSRARLALGH